MKVATDLLALVALTVAFVIPDERAAQQLTLEHNDAPSFAGQIKGKVVNAAEFTESLLDGTIDAADKAGKKTAELIESWDSMLKFEAQEWLNSEYERPRPGKPHRPHRPPPHRRSNQTVYQLIAGSNYTTKLAKLINEYPDLLKALNGTAANYTIFAPIDAAFDKIPKHKKPSKEFVEKILTYHVSPDFYPAGRVLRSHTIPSAYNATSLGGYPQRLRVGLGFKGLAVNFYSRIIAADIFGTNGVIHAVDSVLLLPPDTLKIIGYLPGEFSTLELALLKTGLAKELEKAKQKGGTFFAPSNVAFEKLSPHLSGFLFSPAGLKYLKKLLQYHIVPSQTLYSDAFYKGEVAKEPTAQSHFHVDLPTLLEDRTLSVDIASFGPFSTIKVNAFTSVAVADGIASDGVIQVLRDILIPPRSPSEAEDDVYNLSVEDLKRRLIPDDYSQEL